MNAKTSSPSEAIAALEERIGHRFADRGLLDLALTHASAAGTKVPTNERLEFLGDRVLGLLAAEALMARFPQAPEGELAPRLNALVRRERCAAIAAEINLGKYIKVSDGEQGARTKTAILADACEALIAAIYIDGGLDAARSFFGAAWASALEEVDVLPQDAKSALQEWTQEKGRGLPAYTLVSRSGPDHRPEFKVRVGVAGHGEADGAGPSKRAAEQAAAAAFLVKIAAWSQEEAERALSQGGA